MVVGEQEKFASAIIVPDFNYLTFWCKENNLPFEGKEKLISNPKIVDIFNQEVKKINKKLNQYERILRYQLVPHIWGPDSGELSPTLKLRRKFISEKYAMEIIKIYPKQKMG